jgi:UDP-N-acetylglucosamine--N-acetylmuramyl-(pentapeptide) pyrophosphoryl-undecaprenol N-acetylglucosamine transferase
LAAKAYLTPYGVGLGHASRLLLIAQQLGSLGVNLKFSSSGEAAHYISMNGYDCLTTPPVELAWSVDGGFSVKNSIARIPSFFTNFCRQLNMEVRNLVEYSPNIIVSDTRLSPVLSGQLVGIPSIVIMNQLKLLLSPRLRELRIARLYEKINGEILGIMWSLADKIIVPDLPPPYTLAEHTTCDTSTVTKKLQYVGFTVPRLPLEDGPIGRVEKNLGFQRSKPVVFVHISGPSDTRMGLVRTVMDACKDLGPEIQYVISEGNPKGDTSPKKLAGSGWYYEWCPVKDEIFAMSNVLVLRGGHAALSQAIQFGKPVLTIPIENHGEQLGNSHKIAKVGAGIVLDPQKLNAIEVKNAIHQVINDPQYQRKANMLMKLAEKLDGVENIVKIVRSYLK